MATKRPSRLVRYAAATMMAATAVIGELIGGSGSLYLTVAVILSIVLALQAIEWLTLRTHHEGAELSARPLPRVSAEKRPIVVIQRNFDRHRDFPVRYRIELDGRPLSSLWVGESVEHQISVGNHEVQAKFDWLSSRPLRFDATEDDVLFFECGPGPGVGFLSMLAAGFLRPKRYLQLHEIKAIDGATATTHLSRGQ